MNSFESIGEKVKPTIVASQEIEEPVVKEEKVYEVKSFEYNNLLEKDGAKIKGSFLYNGKQYYYTASNNMLRPMVFGAKSTDVIEACMNAIIENVNKDFYDENVSSFDYNINHEARYYMDLDREIMIYFAPDGSFKG